MICVLVRSQFFWLYSCSALLNILFSTKYLCRSCNKLFLGCFSSIFVCFFLSAHNISDSVILSSYTCTLAAIHRSPIYTFVLCLWWCVFWSEVDSFDYIAELSYLGFASPQIWSIAPATTDFPMVFFFNFLVFLCSDWRLVCILSFDTCALLQSIHRPQAIFCFCLWRFVIFS